MPGNELAGFSRRVVRRFRWAGRSLALAVVLAGGCLLLLTSAPAGAQGSVVTINSFNYDQADQTHETLTLSVTYNGDAQGGLLSFEFFLADGYRVSEVVGTTGLTDSSECGIDEENANAVLCSFNGEIAMGDTFTITFTTESLYPTGQTNTWTASDFNGDYDQNPPIIGPPYPPCASVTIDPPSLPQGTAGIAYSQQLTASPGGPYTFTAASLPVWLSLSPAGVLAGTPPRAGTIPLLQVTATAGSCSGTRGYTWTVNPGTGTGTGTTPPGSECEATLRVRKVFYVRAVKFDGDVIEEKLGSYATVLSPALTDYELDDGRGGLVYDIAVTNTSKRDCTATGVQITDDLPADFKCGGGRTAGQTSSAVQAGEFKCHGSGAFVIVNVSKLPPDEPLNVDVYGSFTRKGHSTNVARAKAENADEVKSEPIHVDVLTNRAFKKLKQKLDQENKHPK
jgi:hypothetical protein